jgi:predicted anti-sigma-YlaC factor YlaD
MIENDELKRSLGSYLMGALDPTERRAVEVHLQTCEACRGELASYAGLPGLLSRLSREEAMSEALLPPPSLLPAVLRAVEAQRTAQVTRLRRWRAAGAAGLVAAAAAAVVLIDLPQTGPSRTSLAPLAGAVSSGDVALEAKPWGTALHLRVRVPNATSYVAWAVDAAGTRTVAATWGRTAKGRMDVDGATALRGQELRTILVTTGSGTPLLTLRRT